ncbi:hypothetical protein H0H93_009971 [Arthromyces matolae]|nr:hypothetical protein H0H93_009971 [Arthromyces matolae]
MTKVRFRARSRVFATLTIPVVRHRNPWKVLFLFLRQRSTFDPEVGFRARLYYFPRNPSKAEYLRRGTRFNTEKSFERQIPATTHQIQDQGTIILRTFNSGALVPDWARR